MLKKLKRQEMRLYWIDDKGDKHDGYPSGLRGDVSGISGYVSGLRGDVSGLRGDVSGLRGDVSWITGDINECKITEDDRRNCLNIEDLVE